MKSSLNIFALSFLCAVPCVAQQNPKIPSAPTKPVAPAAPAPPAVPVRSDQNVEEHIRKAAEDLARVKGNLGDIAKLNLSFADPFNDRDESARTLIIPQETTDAKDQSDTEEDLNVMARILEKASTSRDERNARSYGIYFRSPFGSSPALRNLYLGGYGAIFFLNVNYLLTPAPARADDSDVKEDQGSEWEEARRELSQPRGNRSGFAIPPEQPASPFASRGIPEYDADQVESLQKNLAQALKNAVHIRKLKSDETVTIVVTGRTPSPGPKPAKVKAKGRNDGPESLAVPREKMILRARKSDIEAFQSDKLSFEDFRKRLRIFLG